VLYGFPGLRLRTDSITFTTPTLMPSSTYYRARGVFWRQARFDFIIEEVDVDNVTFSVILTNDQEVVNGDSFVVSEEGGEQSKTLELGVPVQFNVAVGSSFILNVVSSA
jgi:hypothetical protein